MEENIENEIPLKGRIMQYKGPFTNASIINLEYNSKIGISMNEDDYMSLMPDPTQENEQINQEIEQGDPPFSFILRRGDGSNQTDDKEIFLGKTYIYESDAPIPAGAILFPKGAPKSTLVQVVYCDYYEDN